MQLHSLHRIPTDQQPSHNVKSLHKEEGRTSLIWQNAHRIIVKTAESENLQNKAINLLFSEKIRIEEDSRWKELYRNQVRMLMNK